MTTRLCLLAAGSTQVPRRICRARNNVNGYLTLCAMRSCAPRQVQNLLSAQQAVDSCKSALRGDIKTRAVGWQAGILHLAPLESCPNPKYRDHVRVQQRAALEAARERRDEALRECEKAGIGMDVINAHKLAQQNLLRRCFGRF